VFGVTNQTLGSLALAIGTTLILRIGTKKIYALITAVPCAFVAVTTFAAGIMNIQLYLARNMVLNTVLSVVILVLVAIIIVDNVRGVDGSPEDGEAHRHEHRAGSRLLSARSGRSSAWYDKTLA
jgi:carbon starvation protein CstA